MKKIILILTIIIIILALGIYVLVAMRKNQQSPINNQPTPSQNQIDTPLNNSPTSLPTLDPTVVKLQEEQTQADYNYAVKQEDTFKNFPWLDKLPIQNENYFVYYDTDQNKFFGQLYVAENQETLKQEILQKLNDLGVQTEKYEIIWQQL